MSRLSVDLAMRKRQWVSERRVVLLFPSSASERTRISVVRTSERNTRFYREIGPAAETSQAYEPGTAGNDLPYVMWQVLPDGRVGFADLTLTIRAACNGVFVYNGRTMSPIGCHCLALALEADASVQRGAAEFTCCVDTGRAMSRKSAEKLHKTRVVARCPLFSCAGSVMPPVPAHFCVTGPLKTGQKWAKSRREKLTSRQCSDPSHSNEAGHVVSNCAIAVARRNKRFVARCVGCDEFSPKSCKAVTAQTPMGTHRGMSVKLAAGHLQSRLRDDPSQYHRYSHVKAHYDGILSEQTPRLLAALAACAAVELKLAPSTKTQTLLAIGARFASAFLPALLASRLECTDIVACIFQSDVMRGIIAADRPSKKKCIFADSVIWDLIFGSGFGTFQKDTVASGVSRANFFNFVAPDVARGVPGREAAKADLSRETGQSQLELSRVVTERSAPHIFGDVPDRRYYDEAMVQMACGLSKLLIKLDVTFTGSASNVELPQYSRTYGKRSVKTTEDGTCVEVVISDGELLTWALLQQILLRARREVEDLPHRPIIRLKITANLKRTYLGCSGHLLPHHFASLFSQCFSDPASIKADPKKQRPLMGSTLAVLCMLSSVYPEAISMSPLKEEFHSGRLHPSTEDCPEVKKRAAALLSSDAPSLALGLDLFAGAPSLMGQEFDVKRFEKLVSVISATAPATYGTYSRVSSLAPSFRTGDDAESEHSSSSFSARVAMAHRKRSSSVLTPDPDSGPPPAKRAFLEKEGTLNAAMRSFIEASEAGGP